MWGVFAFQSRGPWTLLRVPRKSEMTNTFIYSDKQNRPSLHPLSPSSLFYTLPPPAPPRSEPSSARWGHCMGHPTPTPKAQERGAGRGWLRAGWAPLFTFCCALSLGAAGGGRRGQGEVEKRTARLPAPALPRRSQCSAPPVPSGPHPNPPPPGPGPGGRALRSRPSSRD